MKYLPAAVFVSAFLYSCLLAPLPKKEDPVPAGLGKVLPGGDLRARIDRSLTALTEDTGKPENLFAADSTIDPAQRVGDALLGNLLLCSALGTDQKAAEKIYALIIPRINEKGYLGEILTDGANERQLAGHARLIRALCEYYRANGESAALDMAQMICDSLFVPTLGILDNYPLPEIPRINVFFAPDSLSPNDLPAHNSVPSPVKVGKWTLGSRYGDIFTAIDPLAQLYGYRKSGNTYSVLEALVSLFEKSAGDFPGSGTGAYLSALRGLVRYGEVTGNSGPVQDAAKGWEKFSRSSITEMYGTSGATPEGSAIVYPEDVSQAYIVAMRLWAFTGDGDYLQAAERIFYNSVASAQREDGRFTCLRSDTVDGRLSRCEGDLYGGTLSWVEALPAAVDFSYYVTGNKILIPFYAEGELILAEQGVRLVQQTGYPTDSTIRITVEQAPKRGIGLWLHFPSYMTAKSITRNDGQHLSGTVNNVGLLEMREVYRTGDVIDFAYRFGPKWVETASEDISDSDIYKATYGPLLLGYRSAEMLWLERGVALKWEDGHSDLDPSLTYAKDTVSRKVLVNPSVAREPLTPAALKPIYQPVDRYAGGDILPEYFLVRIGKE